MLWIDIETTGLDPDTDKVLQIAYVLTNFDLTLVHSFREITIQNSNALHSLNNWCKEVHSQNGLLDLVQNSDYDLQKAQTEIILNINSKLGVRDTLYLSGNSVHFDKAFLRKHFPLLHDRLSHRIIDVSTMAVISKQLYPQLYSERPKKLYCHTANQDIIESMEEYKYYLDNLFKQHREQVEKEKYECSKQ